MQPVVTVTEGKLKGCQKTNFNGEKFYSFLAIPFAKPPVGELRFKAPEPAEPWTGIKDATVDGDCCYNRNEFLRYIEGTEDCLHLNVFTQKLPGKSADLKPVMVWIHGGAFIHGSNKTKLFGPEFLMTEDIVLVTINYRLGFLGFLNLDDTSLGVPGNAGLKDQRLALKWVQKNIRNFNGDPGNVTIFGESAGAASAHYHVLSPSSKGLFHKAVLQSGCTLNPWASSENFSIPFAKTIDENVTTEKEALELLRSLPVEELFAAQEEFSKSLGLKLIGPVIERPNPTAVITTQPAQIIALGEYNKVPILLGYCDREGQLLEVFQRLALAAAKPAIDIFSKFNIEMLLPPSVDKEDQKSKLLLKKISDTYLHGPLAADKYLLSTDIYFLSGIIASAKLHAKTSTYPVFLYRMSLDAGLNLLKRIVKLTDPGTCHGDDVGYLFNVHFAADFLERGETEEIAIRRFVKLWTNFAKTGNPTPEGNDLNVTWKPFHDNQLNFLDIGIELTLQSDPEPERMKLWKEIFQMNPATAGLL